MTAYIYNLTFSAPASKAPNLAKGQYSPTPPGASGNQFVPGDTIQYTYSGPPGSPSPTCSVMNVTKLAAPALERLNPFKGFQAQSLSTIDLLNNPSGLTIADTAAPPKGSPKNKWGFEIYFTVAGTQYHLPDPEFEVGSN